MKARMLASWCLLLGCAPAPMERPIAVTPPAPDRMARQVAPAAPEVTPERSTGGGKPDPGEPPPLPRGTVVLHVGSSSAAALGVDLKRELEERGIKNVLKYKEATYIPQWASPSMGLAELLTQHDPDLVIVNVGGNEVGMLDPSVRADPIKRLVKMIGDRPCLWVGAPRWKGQPHTGIREVIQESCSPCRYVDTDALVPDMRPAPDGIHPTIPERHRWAKRMIQWMALNRDPDDKRPWGFKKALEMPPPER